MEDLQIIQSDEPDNLNDGLKLAHRGALKQAFRQMLMDLTEEKSKKLEEIVIQEDDLVLIIDKFLIIDEFLQAGEDLALKILGDHGSFAAEHELLKKVRSATILAHICLNMLQEGEKTSCSKTTLKSMYLALR